MDMQIDILTLFPESVDAMLNVSILGRAQERGYIAIRTHQIRAHLAAAGHPLAGDSLYGAELPCPSGFLLHHGRVSLPDFQAFRLPAWLPLLPREAQEKATAFLGMEEE